MSSLSSKTHSKQSQETKHKISELEFQINEFKDQILNLDKLKDKKMSKIQQKNSENLGKLETILKQKGSINQPIKSKFGP